MAQQSYAFDLPQWRTPHKLNTLITGLLIGSLGWVGCYLWLGQRLWRNGLMLNDKLNQLLMLLAIGLGVVVVAGWTMLWPQLRARWQARSGKSEWPALSLQQIQALTPSEFEAYTAYRLFKRQGYRVINTPDVKDGGIDVLVTDAFGRLAVVQCKRYNSTVGVATVRDLYGTMIDAGAGRAYLVASSRISGAARDWVSDKPIGLIDGERLAELSKAEPNSAYLFNLRQHDLLPQNQIEIA